MILPRIACCAFGAGGTTELALCRLDELGMMRGVCVNMRDYESGLSNQWEREMGALGRGLDDEFPDIGTERLELVAMTRESLLCQLASTGTDAESLSRDAQMRRELGRLLEAQVPESWPHENWEPHVCEYLLKLIEGDREAAGWCRYLMVREGEGRTLVGTFGAGFPRADAGESEIGYGLLPAWQRQGYAPEAVMAMLPWLESRQRSGQRIKAFVAQTFPQLRGSIRVLEKCGFEAAGAGFEVGTILFRKRAGRER